jgi:oxygen-independent coproporphyrinogen III oxidase
LNAYLHIPFCTSLCSYCDFTSFAGQEARMDAYGEALCAEIGASGLTGPLKTVYFGGGTPSLLEPGKLKLILEALRAKAGFDPAVEVSLEANPETVSRERLGSYRFLGVNRLSFGAQAFQKEILKKLGRGHEWERVEEAFGQARMAGFDNINLDLMFGLPGQTPAMFRESLQKVLALGPEHLSLYALQVEEGTPLAKQVAEGLALPGEDEVADEYALAQGLLSGSGYEQYEVSNFAKPGRACRHNWNIWRGEDYWGFGVSAVGTVGNLRHSHGDDLADYIRRSAGGPDGLLEYEILPGKVRAWEKLMLQFRTRDGVSQADLLNQAGRCGDAVLDRFRLLQKEGFLLWEEGRVRVTPKGYFVLNGILETLVA